MAVQFVSKRSISLNKLISSQSIFRLELYTSLFILIRFDKQIYGYVSKPTDVPIKYKYYWLEIKC